MRENCLYTPTKFFFCLLCSKGLILLHTRRRLEIFLDYVVWSSTSATSHLLDPVFEPLLSAEEIQLRDALSQTLATLPSGVCVLFSNFLDMHCSSLGPAFCSRSYCFQAHARAPRGRRYLHY